MIIILTYIILSANRGIARVGDSIADCNASFHSDEIFTPAKSSLYITLWSLIPDTKFIL